MIDISGKSVSKRLAIAEGSIKLSKEGVDAIVESNVPKGNVFEAAKIAGMQAVKNTPNVLPYCFANPIDSVDIDFSLSEDHVTVKCEVKGDGKFGLEMEALLGCSVAILTVWDMVRPYEKDKVGMYPETMIEGIKVVKKSREIAETEKVAQKEKEAPFMKRQIVM